MQGTFRFKDTFTRTDHTLDNYRHNNTINIEILHFTTKEKISTY